MDVNAWLQQTVYQHPPDSTPVWPAKELRVADTVHEVVEYAQPAITRGQHVLSDPSFIAPLRLREKDHAHRPCHDSDEHERYSSSPNGNLSIEIDPYARKARRKTHPDHYELKSGAKKRPASKDEPRKRRRRAAHGEDVMHDPTLGRVKNAFNKAGTSKRLTLKNNGDFGIYRHGRAGVPTDNRRSGVPDLTFNDLHFLQRGAAHGEREKEDQPDGQDALPAARGDRSGEGTRISRYFQQEMPVVKQISLSPDNLSNRIAAGYSNSHRAVNRSASNLGHHTASAIRTPIQHSSSTRSMARPRSTVERLAVVHTPRPDAGLLDLMIGSRRTEPHKEPADIQTTDMLNAFDQSHRQAAEPSVAPFASPSQFQPAIAEETLLTAARSSSRRPALPPTVPLESTYGTSSPARRAVSPSADTRELDIRRDLSTPARASFPLHLQAPRCSPSVRPVMTIPKLSVPSTTGPLPQMPALGFPLWREQRDDHFAPLRRTPDWFEKQWQRGRPDQQFHGLDSAHAQSLGLASVFSPSHTHKSSAHKRCPSGSYGDIEPSMVQVEHVQHQRVGAHDLVDIERELGICPASPDHLNRDHNFWKPHSLS